jgi:hypothetical protein
VKRLSINVLAVATVLTLLAAGSWSLALGYADLQFRRLTADGVSAATRIAPGDASYLAQSALLREDFADGARSMEKAVALDPYFSWAWIYLGLAKEKGHDAAGAEQYLLKAATVDRRFNPRWALCDFYYRQAKFDLFWYWARKATEIDESDSRPIFHLAARASPDADSLLKQIAPANDRVRSNFLAYLVEERPSEASSTAVRALVPAIAKEKAPLVISYSDKLIDAGRIDSAVEVWNAMCQRQLLPFAALDPPRGRSLTNQDFAMPPSGQGFDWRLPMIDGITRLNDAQPGELKMRFSGEQPDRCQVLSEKVPVLPGHNYEFAFRNRLVTANVSGGLVWRVYDGPREGVVLTDSGALTNGDWEERALSFRTNLEPLILLSLEYQRPRGSMRLSGTASFSGLVLRFGKAQ